MKKIIEKIRAKIQEIFNKDSLNFPFKVESLHDASELFGVCVFSVSSDYEEKVKNIIYDVEKNLFPENDFGLIPRIKDLETTRLYHKQYFIPHQGDEIIYTSGSTRGFINVNDCWLEFNETFDKGKKIEPFSKNIQEEYALAA